MSIDWSKPIEAVDAAGAVMAAKWHWRDESGDELGVRFVTCDWFGWPFRDGGQPVHKMDRVWTIRNVTPPMTDLSPETVGKLVAFVRRLAINSFDEIHVTANDWSREARAIVAELAETVDPDLVEAREIVALAVEYGRGSATPSSPSVSDFLDGTCDDGRLILRTVAALRDRRALAGGDRS